MKVISLPDFLLQFVTGSVGIKGKEGVRLVQNQEFHVSKMDWSKVRKSHKTEEKYALGTVLKNGRMVFERSRDSLAARAAKMEKEWLDANQHDSRKVIQ